MNRKVVIAIFVIVVLLAAGGWYLLRRPDAVVMASYVPENALGYIEVNDWPRFLNELTETDAWQKIAPAYGIDEKIGNLGRAGWLQRIRIDNEAAILSRSQFAVVLTGLEVRGEEVKPRLALLIETHAKTSTIGGIAERRIAALARRVFGEALSEKSNYAGVEITTYRPAPSRPGGERRLHSAIIGGELILSNHDESLRACIDARLDRTPDMAASFYLRNSQPQVDRDGLVFGFVTGEGVNRLLRFGAYLISNAALRETGLTDILEDVLSDLAARSSAGMAWSPGFEEGRVADRYLLLIKPDLLETVKPMIRVTSGESKALASLPDDIDDLTIVRIEQPNLAIDRVERAISARIGVGQSFLLHQFLLGARESLLGIEPSDPAYAALGDEIASFRFSDDQAEDRIWMIAVHDRSAMRSIAAAYLRTSKIGSERVGKYELLTADGSDSGSAAMAGDFIVFGRRPQVGRLLKSLNDGRKLTQDPRFAAAARFTNPAIALSYDSIARESAVMFADLSRLTGTDTSIRPTAALFERLPLSAGSTTLQDQGLFIETRSSFGNLPFFLSIIAGAANGE